MMAQASPARTIEYVGQIQNRDASRVRPRSVSPRLHPAAEHFAEFRHHRAHMSILAVVEPVPVVREPKVHAQFVERGVGATQVLLACRTALALRFEQGFLKIERTIHEALADRRAKGTRNFFSLRHQPMQEIEGFR